MISTVFYYIWNVVSLGFFSSFKVAVRKGIEDGETTKALAVFRATPRV